MSARAPTSHRGLAWAVWVVLLLLIALDAWRSYGAHNPFNEPPLISLGSGGSARGGHCAIVPPAK